MLAAAGAISAVGSFAGGLSCANDIVAAAKSRGSDRVAVLTIGFFIRRILLGPPLDVKLLKNRARPNGAITAQQNATGV
jgi:hypothetical protein